MPRRKRNLIATQPRPLRRSFLLQRNRPAFLGFNLKNSKKGQKRKMNAIIAQAKHPDKKDPFTGPFFFLINLFKTIFLLELGLSFRLNFGQKLI